jgi:hypothetical protein
MPPAIIPVVAAVGKTVAAAGGLMKSMAVVGAATSLVGVATKNPKLTRIGAVVGGIGSLGSAGAFGAKVQGLGVKAAAPAASAASAAGAGFTPGSTLVPGAGVRAVGQGAGELTAQSGLIAKATALPSAPAVQPTIGAKIGNALTATAGAMRDNPEITKLLAATGVELSNYLSGKTSAEIAELKSKINVNDANAQQLLFNIEQEERRRNNLNQGYLQVNPVFTLPGQANPYQPPGLLSSGVKA